MEIAFVDESKRSNGELGLYVLTAFVAASDEATKLLYRTSLLSHLAPGQEKLHWYGMPEVSRNVIIDAVSGLEVMFCVVARNMPAGEADERARRKCLELLAVELEAFGVTEAVFESRQSTLDHRDRSYLDRLRSMKAPGASVRISHVTGKAEPLLWVADVVAGAFGDYALYNERKWRDVILQKLYSVYSTQ
ncbi:MAG: hypothetical protein RL499_926 [Actinomycetota bacterium]